MSVYESNPNQKPDSDFEPGELHHLVPGNAGRMLDHRRTPMKVVGIHSPSGMFEVEVTGFEDKGAQWTIPFEKVVNFQFEKGGNRASDDEAAAMKETVDRLDQAMKIPVDPADREATLKRIQEQTSAAYRWMEQNSEFLKAGSHLPEVATRVGSPELWRDLQAFMSEQGCLDLETRFSEQYVSNPYSGEMIRGHEITLARMGLVPYVDKKLRNPAALEGDLSEERRSHHMVARLGFLGALWRHLGKDSLLLYRGMVTKKLWGDQRNTFVSSSFSEEVSKSHYLSAPELNGVLLRQNVEVSRVFMTYLETEAMSKQFLEAEAVLFYSADTLF